jgi:hypothetical protein
MRKNPKRIKVPFAVAEALQYAVAHPEECTHQRWATAKEIDEFFGKRKRIRCESCENLKVREELEIIIGLSKNNIEQYKEIICKDCIESDAEDYDDFEYYNSGFME